jgi:hypothetical protein
MKLFVVVPTLTDFDWLAGDESDSEGSAVPDLSGMVALMKAKEEEVAASKVKLDEATGKLKDAEEQLNVGLNESCSL